MLSAERQAPLSVSAAMALAKGALENVTVRLLGEVSEVSNKPGYKAVYFTVKDAGASLPCMMWNNRYAACGVALKVGMLVELSGRFTLYAAKGRMSFDVFGVSLAGEGTLRLQVAQLSRRLQAEGLMDAARKRAVPPFPQRIGLVTSPRGAAVHDVLRTLRRRFPLAEVLLAGVPVEGAGAPAGLVQGLACVASAGVEVILLVRGGGSFEDLMPFNDEGLARAIAACPVPVVTGIGHEPDTSIADLVADVRASTPTAAAEAVSPAPEVLRSALGTAANRLQRAEGRRLREAAARLEAVQSRPLFGDPALLYAGEAAELDVLSDRLSRALPANMRQRTQDLEAKRARMQALAGHLTLRQEAALREGAAKLHALSPLAVLGRGYAVARTDDGRVVASVRAVEPGAGMNVLVSDGEIRCKVEGASRIETAVDRLECSWKQK